MTGNAIYIHSDGNMAVEKAEKAPPLEDMQGFVGGYIEVVHVLFAGEKRQMIVNEEGQITNLPVNPWATSIYHAASLERGEIPRPLIHGNAILLVNLELE